MLSSAQPDGSWLHNEKEGAATCSLTEVLYDAARVWLLAVLELYLT
jgi:hypothetical protein